MDLRTSYQGQEERDAITSLSLQFDILFQLLADLRDTIPSSLVFVFCDVFREYFILIHLSQLNTYKERKKEMKMMTEFLILLKTVFNRYEVQCLSVAIHPPTVNILEV